MIRLQKYSLLNIFREILLQMKLNKLGIANYGYAVKQDSVKNKFKKFINVVLFSVAKLSNIAFSFSAIITADT